MKILQACYTLYLYYTMSLHLPLNTSLMTTLLLATLAVTFSWKNLAKELAASPAAAAAPPSVKLIGIVSAVRSFAILTAFHKFMLPPVAAWRTLLIFY